MRWVLIVAWFLAMGTSAIAGQAAVENPQTYLELAGKDEAAGDVVNAALNFQRALVLDPGYRAAQNEFAAFAATHRIQVRPRSWQDDVVAFVHPETLTMIGSAVGWLGALWLAWMIFAGGATAWRITWGVLLVGVGSALFAMGWSSDPRIADANLAILSGKETTRVLTGPADNSALVVELNPGSAVGVISPRGPWTYVITPSGAKGWVGSDRLVPVLPSADSDG